MYCDGCGEPLAYQTKFCTKCGKETNEAPRAIPGKQGLDPRRFVGGEAPAVSVSNTGSGRGNAAPQSTGEPKPVGSVNSSLAGTYEYVKPGSFEKSTQVLTLNADGTCSYSENGETSMEIFTSSGNGTWDCCEGVLRVVVQALTRDTKFKSKPIVPGIKEGTTVEYNITVPITEQEIANATAHGTNKWRIKK
mmetsp:Transcript_91505/g.137005  ORF Transcript_91505/g.137005 Transcript_91505/m.137005 type:complete len:192 (+) Transcript_91505:10-585(+)